MLENILLLQLHETKDHTTFSNKKIFSKIINQIVDLEKNGITIDLCSEQKTVYFALLLVLGDNVGLNTILGVNTSFNASNFCRACFADKTVTRSSLSENVDVLRTKENYAKDIVGCTNGIKEECIFHAVPSFHVTDNVSFDPMHDIFEGICRYEVAKILHFLIVTD